MEYDWLEPAFPLEYVLDVAKGADIVAVVTPNNPTGLAIDESSFLELCEATRGKLLLVDLAYVEFASFDPTEIALGHEHVVVVRSLSKGWGIAGLRVGYVCASPRAISALRAAGSPYSVAAPSLVLAKAWLDRGQDVSREFAARVTGYRQRLYDLFAARGIECWRSEANFVMFRVPDARSLHRAIAAHGVAVRAFPNHERIADCLRATCGGDAREQEILEFALTRAWDDLQVAEGEQGQ
jgi:histidinol-phosphate aminotransferase